MNLEQFVAAQKFFDTLRERAIQEGGRECDKVPVSPHNADIYFRTAAYAAALLYQKGAARSQKLEREGVVNLSTIVGASLGSAVDALTDYLVHGERAFTKDEYEQLARACYSAKRLLEKEER